MLLVGTVILGTGCSLILFNRQRDGTWSPFDTAAIIVVVGCVYVGFTAGDHLHFFRDEHRTGYLDGSIAAKAGVVCDIGFVLVRIDADPASAIYRCPHNITLGDPLEELFVPWPAYDEGSSPELLRAIRQLEAGIGMDSLR